LITQHAVIIVDAQNRSMSGVIEHHDLFTATPRIADLRRPRLVKFAHFATVVDHVDAERPSNRTVRCESNRPEPSISPVPNPPQPKHVSSAVDRVFPVPIAEPWAVRSGPPVSVALADWAGLPASAPVERASADRYVAGYDFLDLTFLISPLLVLLLVVIGNLLQNVDADSDVYRGRPLRFRPASSTVFING
jgi:hypothetical protein